MFVKFLPLQIDPFVTGQVVQCAGLDTVHEADGFPFGGYEIEIATRIAGIFRDFENPLGQNIGATKIVKKPAVEAKLPNRGLYTFQVKTGGGGS